MNVACYRFSSTLGRCWGSYAALVVVIAYVRGHFDANPEIWTAVGLAGLPFDMAVEIEMIASVRD